MGSNKTVTGIINFVDAEIRLEHCFSDRLLAIGTSTASRESYSRSTAPDYGYPSDSGSDDVYLITVEARDDQSNSARLDVTARVTNLTK